MVEHAVRAAATDAGVVRHRRAHDAEGAGLAGDARVARAALRPVGARLIRNNSS